MRKIILWLVLSLVVTHCATTPSKFISFYNSVEENYPEARYLTSIGSASSLSQAQERAQGNLAKIFSSRIENDEVISKNVVTIDGSTSQSEYLSRSTFVSARIDIEGIEIVETFYDESERTYYALAILNKRQAEARWSDELNVISSSILTIEQALSEDLPPYETIHKSRQLHQAISNHNLLVRRLQIVNPAGNYRQKHDNSIQILREATERLSFAVITDLSELQPLAAQALAAEGMPEQDIELADLLVEITLTELPKSTFNGWITYRSNLELSLTYLDNPPRTHQWRLKTDSVDEQRTLERMEALIIKTINEELFSTVIDVLNDKES